MYYYEGLIKETHRICVAVLRPNESVIWERKKKRRRLDDQDMEKEFRNARHQLACLESSYIREEWAIDSSELSVEDIYSRYLIDFVEGAAKYQ